MACTAWLPSSCAVSSTVSGAPADFVFDLAQAFDMGSWYLWLELFANLRRGGQIDALTKRLLALDPEEASRLAYTPLVRLPLWKHQEAAFAKWNQDGRSGIIEMATATGKTLVGLYAIQELAKETDPARSFRVRVICHSIAILNQWRREVIDKLDVPFDPENDYLTAIHLDGDRTVDVFFNTVQSVYRDPRSYSADFLIADEVHHLGAEQYLGGPYSARPVQNGTLGHCRRQGEPRALAQQPRGCGRYVYVGRGPTVTASSRSSSG